MCIKDFSQNVIMLTMTITFFGCSDKDDDKESALNDILMSQTFIDDSYNIESQALEQISKTIKSDSLASDNVIVENYSISTQTKLKPDTEAKKQIFLAIKNNDFNGLKSLMDKYFITGLRDKSSYTPLIRAAKVASKTGKLHILKLLSVSPEVDINGMDGFGYTALTWAGIENHYSATNMLLSTPFDINPNARDLNGRTALIWSVLTQNIPSMQDKYGAFNALLTAPGIDINAFDNINQWTALIYAVRLNGVDDSIPSNVRVDTERLDLVTALVRRGVDLKHEDKFGFTALDWAKALNRSQKMVEMLDYNNPMRIITDPEQ